MHCIDLECENIPKSPDADAGRLLIQNGALSQDGTFLVSKSYVLGLLFACFMLSVIVKLFEAIVRTCEIRFSYEKHMLY